MENDLFDVRICNESYSTSNQVNTYIEIDGEKYGHIISPKTGFPSRNMQIGVITEKAFIGDMISTGLYNQSPEDFYAIMKNLQKELEIEGYLIDEKGEKKAVLIPISLWEEIISERETAYLLSNDVMKTRLLEAKNRETGISWEAVREELGI